MTADELRALADWLYQAVPNSMSPVWEKKLDQVRAIIRTVADLQAPARKARANWRRQRPTIRAALTRELGDALAAIVERIVQAGEST